MDGRKKTRREEKNKSRSKVESGKEERQKGSYSINGKRRSERKKKNQVEKERKEFCKEDCFTVVLCGF